MAPSGIFASALRQAECPICLQPLDPSGSSRSASRSCSQTRSLVDPCQDPSPSPSPSTTAPPRTNGGFHISTVFKAPAFTPNAVLYCGHVLHSLCVLQLCEYAGSNGPTCPVCRAPLSEEERKTVPFDPQPLPLNTPLAIHVSSPVPTASANQPEGADDVQGSEEDGEVTLIAARRVPPEENYRARLLRRADNYESRCTTIQQREEHLRHNVAELQRDVTELVETERSARRRAAIFAESRESVERTTQLREVCVQTRQGLDTATADLAAAIRERAELRAELDKYARKMRRLEGS